jgi:ribosomal protein S18 acetylase RimI-like enzyme
MVRLKELGDVVRLTQAAARGEQPEPLEMTLRDSTRAQLRPIQPEDKGRLQQGLQLLSPRSRFLRFHARIDHLTDDQLAYATEIDHHDHVAWVALDADHPEVPGMALGQYVRLEGSPHVAEAAITVVDHYQGRGLGTIMLALLAEVALANDIQVFRNYVLADNDAMLELFDQLGAERELITDGVYEVDFRLPEDLADLPDTPAGRAVRELAKQDAPGSLLAAIAPPVWVQRWRRRRDVPDEPMPMVPDWPERGPFGDWVDAALEDARDPDDEHDGHDPATP